MKRSIRPLVFTTVMLAISVRSILAGSDNGRFDIYWVDVEGGAATLMVTPRGESVLIDSGNPGHRDPDRIVKVATEVARLKRIDYLITTHYHRDHYGGAATLAALIPIGTVFDNGVFDQMPDNPGAAYFDFPSKKRAVINPGDVLPLKQNDGKTRISMRCLATRKTFLKPADDAPDNGTNCAAHRPKPRDGSDNANSVVTLVEFGPFRFFDGGDLTWNQEMQLVCPKNQIGEVDVYQVTHHGLDSSNNPVVLQSLKPVVAVMNNGHKKGCLPEVFANLKETKSLQTIYQVHKNLRPDGAMNNTDDKFIANHHATQDCQGNYVALSVAADGGSYTVSIPAHGHQATYRTRAAKD